MATTKRISFDYFGEYITDNPQAVKLFESFLDVLDAKNVVWSNRVAGDSQFYIEYVSTPRTDKIVNQTLQALAPKQV
jgi:hypothetical protein